MKATRKGKKHILINCHDGEGGVFKVAEVEKFISDNKLNVSVDQLLNTPTLLSEFYRIYF